VGRYVLCGARAERSILIVVVAEFAQSLPKKPKKQNNFIANLPTNNRKKLLDDAAVIIGGLKRIGKVCVLL
jgi:hypothetical protein